ncbi:VCBS domain-containing protein, partial [Pseudomonas sp. MPR-R5A]|uniref:VCBS domain-containing protein n=1 Tax=Pseudomonas sp. MPR-R5A TaxID=2070626 RepID=UPI000CBFE994
LVSNQAVFTLTIGADGSYTFTQIRALVHAGVGEGGRDLVFNFTATDQDGDGANGTLTVTADDDTPVANAVIAQMLTDDEGKAPFASSSIE